MTTALPAPHIWVGEARAVATGEVCRLHLNCAEHWCIDELGNPPFVIADALSRHLADCTDTDGWILDALNGDLRPLSREPFRDKTSKQRNLLIALMKQRIEADTATREVVARILQTSIEAYGQLQTASRSESLSPGVVPPLEDSGDAEFFIMLFMLENEGLQNHFETHTAAHLSQLSFTHAATALTISPSDLRRWYSEYATPYRFDLAVPTDPFTPFGFLGVFGKRLGFPPHRIAGIPGDLFITSLGCFVDRRGAG